MKKIICIFSCFFCLQTCYAKEIIVPQNTQIDLKVKKVTHSKRISDDYRIKAEIINDIIIDNIIVFSSENKAFLLVKDYEKAKGFGRGGKIIIDGGIAYDNNNKAHKVDIKKVYTTENDSWIVRWIPFNKGNQVYIYPSETFNTTLTKNFKFNQNTTNKNSINNQKQNKTVIQFGIKNTNN